MKPIRRFLMVACLIAVLGLAAAPAYSLIDATRISDRACGIAPLNGGLLLFVGAGTHKEVWFSDGTAAGTVFVKALPDKTAEQNWITIEDKVSASSGVIFQYAEWFADESEPGTCPQIVASSIWASDGTTAGTVMLLGGDYVSMTDVGTAGNTSIFYTFDRSDDSNKLWRSDGTPAGTYVLKADFAAKAGVAMNDVLYFTGEPSGSSRYSLWRTDGTVDGTYTLLPAGAGCSNNFVQFGDILYFRAATGTELYRLFRTDGTVEGTYALQPEGSYCESVLSAVNNLLYFRGQTTDSVKGLFRSDGTPDGTYRITESGNFSIGRPVAAGNRAVFAASPGTGYTGLWGTDGTSEGTIFLLETAQWEEPRYITALGDAAYFLLNDGLGGSGLWKTDGTPAGTELVVDFEDASTDVMAAIDGRLYFCCEFRGEVYGLVVYSSDGTAAGTLPMSDPIPTKDGPTEIAPDKCMPPPLVREFWNHYGLIYLVWDNDLIGLNDGQFEEVVLHDSALDVYTYDCSYPVLLGDLLFFGSHNGLWAVSTSFRFTQTPHAPWREVGDPLRLNVACEGYAGSISYQWIKDGDPIDGATDSELNIESLTEDDTGWYSCRVTDSAKAVHETEPIFVEVFASLPAAGTLALGGLALSIAVTATGAIRRRRI